MIQNYEQTKAFYGTGEEAEEIEDLHLAAKALVEGKLDRMCSLIDALESHSEACRKQIETNDWTVKTLKSLVEEAVLMTPQKRIDGLAYVAKIKTNPPSVVVKDAAKIPDKYKNWEFSASDKFSAEDMATFCKYASFALQKNVSSFSDISEDEKNMLTDFFEKTIDKKKLSQDLKAKLLIDGAELSSREQLDIKPGKSLPASKKDKVLKIESGSGK